MNAKRHFNNGINADDDFEFITEGQYVNAENMRFGTTDTGATGRLETIGGTIELINSYLPAGVNTGNGGCEDDETNRIIFFIYNSLGNHAIYCYDKPSATMYKVLLNSQVTGGLNFSLSHFIHSPKYIDGKLYWTEGSNNEPRKINVESGIKLNHPSFTTTQSAYISPLPKWSITQIKRPPLFQIIAIKNQDTAYKNNFISQKAYQFCYFYKYKDNEASALSTFSTLMPANFASELNNSINLSLALTEVIDDDVFSISFCVKYGNLGGISIIKIYDKVKDATAITAHNAGTAIAFTFYDDVAFNFLDNVSSVTSFHNVPLASEAQEQAKDRLFLGNNTFGYNTPNTSSLTTTLGITDSGGGGTFVSEWKYTDLTYFYGGAFSVERYYYLYNATLSPSVYFYNAFQSSVPPTSVNSNAADIQQYSESGLAFYILSNRSPRTSGATWGGYPYNTNSTLYFRNANYPYPGPSINLVYIVTIQFVPFFKSGCTYNVSTAFFDKYRRKCGVIDISNKIVVPDRTFSQTAFATIINWTLNNASILTEIPDWAYYYQIHITKNLTTRFFLQGKTVGAAYATKDMTTGLISYTSTTYDHNTTYALALNISTLIGYGYGYIFQEGDMAKVYKNPSTNYLSRVLGTDGNYVLLAPINIGPVTIATEAIGFEIFTPYKQSSLEPFFETGDIHEVVLPTTPNRSYSTLTGTINGDCYAILRTFSDNSIFVTEAMSPNDAVWKNWEMDRGWVNFIDKIGQKTLKNNIVFSDVYLPGTKTNGLNIFQPLNSQDLDSDNGPLRKLMLANKVQLDGTILLGICENETASCYLGETELFDTQGSAYIARSANVIGSVKALAGSKGTKHPESVFQQNGLVEWYDVRNGCFVQYSNNGLFSISNNKLKRAAKLLTNGLVDGQLIIGGCDPYHKEFLFSIPTTESAPKGQLIDYTGVIYPYDIYDGQQKTLVYKYEMDKWVGAYRYNAETFIRLGSNLYSIKAGKFYLHNTSSTTIYGVPIISKVMCVFPIHDTMQTFDSIEVSANIQPDFVHLRTESPNVQSSDIFGNADPTISEFTNKEGNWYAPIRRDRLSPNVTGSYFNKELTGDKMIGKYLLASVEFDSNVALKFINVSSTVNEGHFIQK